MDEIIADLQLHSKYSRAVSSKMDLFEIARWANRKGIQLVATGDWTHPFWFQAIKDNLTEVWPGIFRLKESLPEIKGEVYFLLSTEISSIYSQGGRTRRIHNLVFSPCLETCEKIIAVLKSRGAKLMSDGRPIISLSAKSLLELVLEADSQALLIPAHAWTPWFSLYGSMSGFDSLEECFGDLASQIYAIETGLSSDPAMNWSISQLDNRSIVSFSDAHSGAKLGRETTVFVSGNDRPISEFSYEDIIGAIKREPGELKIGYTIEFFPEEGKYHWSGHRDHQIRYSPDDEEKYGRLCPVCQRPLTIGVESRVRSLSNRKINNLQQIKNSLGVTFVGDAKNRRPPFVSLVPLLEILTEIYRSPTKALREYRRLAESFTAEFDLLLKKPLAEIEKHGGGKLAQAIGLVRERKVTVEPGYDGVFGTVKVLAEESDSQLGLFA